MDIIYAQGRASATHVMEGMPDPPSRAAVRTLLRILEAKGHLRHVKSGKEFIHYPVRARNKVANSVLDGVLRTFFDGSIEQAVAARLADRGTKVPDDELKRMAFLIRQTRAKEK